jgi:hypothetical protein
MTLESLHQLELSLMRAAFDISCDRLQLSTDMANLDERHSQLASIVQTLVERGFDDPRDVANLAARIFLNNKNA